jgi:hypothetical protein
MLSRHSGGQSGQSLTFLRRYEPTQRGSRRWDLKPLPCGVDHLLRRRLADAKPTPGLRYRASSAAQFRDATEQLELSLRGPSVSTSTIEHEMFGADTTPVVASVDHVLVGRYWSIGQLPSVPVSPNHLAGRLVEFIEVAKLAIALAVHRADPDPAGRGSLD